MFFNFDYWSMSVQILVKIWFFISGYLLNVCIYVYVYICICISVCVCCKTCVLRVTIRDLKPWLFRVGSWIWLGWLRLVGLTFYVFIIFRKYHFAFFDTFYCWIAVFLRFLLLQGSFMLLLDDRLKGCLPNWIIY